MFYRLSLLVMCMIAGILAIHNASCLASTGNGLKGEYYDNMDLTNLKVTRIDPEINFSWGEGAPAPSIGADTFSVRWTGKIVPRYSESYTFYMKSDDGVRVWINGQKVIDAWNDHTVYEIAGQTIGNYTISVGLCKNDF
ncbi:PA14 domain protein [Paenibacillus konkukensis]|uniref:PA14 domain protein n=2 Tax=Paenibacillus konkukensis TaxID=2020716 RepID=A0ABY4RYY7_9BACL|nr:PA14 domain protein [Paenibacillus konkukensis]